MAQPSLSPSASGGGVTLSRQIQKVCRTALEGLFLVDGTRRFLRANDPGTRIVGLPRKQLLGRRIDEFTPPDRLVTLAQLWEDLEREGMLTGPYEMLRADGTRVLVEYRATWDFVPGQHLVAVREISPVPVRPLEAHESGDVPLTPREREVLQLAAEGHSTSQIAESLFVSAATIKTHFEHIYGKLGVRDRVAAVAYGMRRGLID